MIEEPDVHKAPAHVTGYRWMAEVNALLSSGRCYHDNGCGRQFLHGGAMEAC
jgi:hypothetical protein